MDLKNTIQEEINKYLEETPDSITNYTGLFRYGDEIGWEDDDAYGFGYVGGEMIVTGKGKAHDDMRDDKSKLRRRDYTFAGRIWTFNKIISFWEYPPPNLIFKVIGDLRKNLHLNINDSYKIETLPTKVTKDKLSRGPLDWNYKSAEGESVNPIFLSPTEYSKLGDVQQLSPEERAKPHPFSPEKPIKGSGADKYGTQKPLAYRQSLVRSEGNELEESPDRIYFPDGPPHYGKELDWGYGDNDFAFGYDRDTYELYISKPGSTHSSMVDIDNKVIMDVDRANLDYAGRIWTKDRIISFWEFPPTHMIKEVLSDLEDRLKIKILGVPDWKIETLEDMVDQDIPNEEDFHWEDRAHSEMDKGVSFISPDEYSNLTNIQQRSAAERAKPHPFSPEKPIKGSGADKYSKQKPLAYRQALMRSEGIIREELLGDYRSGWYKKTPIEVYSNPKSIKRMGTSMRGVVDKEGNLYVADGGEDGVTVHQEIADFLKSKGLISKTFSTPDGKEINYVGVHRHEDTNDFYLGESVSNVVLNNEEFKIQVEEIFKKAKIKNPAINFIMRDIWGY